MIIKEADGTMAVNIAPLIADFRVTLNAFRGVASEPDIQSAVQEYHDFLSSGYPVFYASDGDMPVGYIVCRTEPPCIWVEHLFVRSEYRRKGIASSLFEKAEELARSMGEETVFTYVHPNNDGIIGFLRSKGYTVLNLIEIRKAYRDEKLSDTIRVGNHIFDY